MADTSGHKADALIENLVHESFRWDFFQAVRQIECANPEKPRMGTSRHTSEDPVRFCQKPTLAFCPTAIAEVKKAKETQNAPKMFVNFLGLVGPNGPMPRSITEYAFHRIHHRKDFTLARFFDMFNHRIISIFYRAWASSRQTLALDRPEDQRWTRFIGSLFGVKMDSSKKDEVLSKFASLRFAGHLVNRTRHSAGLSAILRDFFQVPVQILQYFGHWIEIPKDYCCRLGRFPESGTLGKSIITGTRIWDVQQKFRIVFGPLDYSSYQRFLPGTGSLERLKVWVNTYVGKELKWDVQFILKAGEIPKTSLGKTSRLGLTTWLSTQPFLEDADHLIIGPFNE